MLLAVDVGNTNTVLGLFDGDALRADWRLSTHPSRTEDEWAMEMAGVFALSRIDRGVVDAAILSSVVPSLTEVLSGMIRTHFGVTPLQVGPGVKTGIKILYENPLEVGADRIVNSVAAFTLVNGAAIVVDFGTATTFDAISGKGEYLGGVIVPGLQISADVLFMRAAKLPRVEVRKPPRLIGRNTVHSIQAGLYFGYVNMVNGMLAMMKAEMDGTPLVIATGGLSGTLAPDLRAVDRYEPNLTLEGLRLIHLKNR